ncbi:MAG TPA: alpha/beta hydrolase, partial [Actinomycetota bacterium]|nr:alpha/beta hydrolase [Actinomycetota bacterium]
MIASSDDLRFVHRYVKGSSPTTLLLLHGTGGDENDLLPLGRQVLPEAHLLSPRGKVLENGMPRFFKRLAMGVFDMEDLTQQTHALADFVEQAADHYRLDRDEIVALGYSNGANIAASLLLLHPNLLRRAALLHAMLPFDPGEFPDLGGTLVLLTGGRQDPYIAAEQTQALADLLGRAGADVTLEWQPGGHQLTHQEIETL